LLLQHGIPDHDSVAELVNDIIAKREAGNPPAPASARRDQPPEVTQHPIAPAIVDDARPSQGVEVPGNPPQPPENEDGE